MSLEPGSDPKTRVRFSVRTAEFLALPCVLLGVVEGSRGRWDAELNVGSSPLVSCRPVWACGFVPWRNAKLVHTVCKDSMQGANACRISHASHSSCACPDHYNKEQMPRHVLDSLDAHMEYLPSLGSAAAETAGVKRRGQNTPALNRVRWQNTTQDDKELSCGDSVLLTSSLISLSFPFNIFSISRHL